MKSQNNGEWYADGLRFECTQCGNCCTGAPGFVWMSDAEIAAIALHLQLSQAEFLRRHAHQVDGRWTLNERLSPEGYDCVFLQRDAQGKSLCTIYPVRPAQCRTWPFWPENLKRPPHWNQVARRCPGVNQGSIVPIEQIRIRRDQTPSM